ncbi:TRAP transporter small permease [Roseovarius sp.]|uniref:TRAP transporter small permease n=1 Tax=Roseovarius sp. TaxID=1486281 RepID=UPI0035167999
MTKAFDLILSTYRVAGGLLVLAMIVLILASIVLRELFGNPLVWANEIALALFLWIIFIGAGTAFAGNIRIRFTLLTSGLPSRLRMLADRLATFAGIVLLCTFFYVSIRMVWVFRNQRFASIDLPVMLEWIALPVGLALAILSLVRFLISPPTQEDNAAPPAMENRE